MGILLNTKELFKFLVGMWWKVESMIVNTRNHYLNALQNEVQKLVDDVPLNNITKRYLGCL